jgi:hypothetical protein
MKQILDEVKRKAYQAIKNSNDSELRLPDYSAKVEKLFLPEELQLVGEKEKSDIMDIPMPQWMSESGMGGTLNPHESGQKVHMFMGVNGSIEIFDFLAKNRQLPMTNEFQAFRDNKRVGLLYKGYARKITGNPSVIEELKKDSDAKFNGVKEIFNRVNDEIRFFAEREFRPLIKKTIEEEIKRRDDNNDARNSL